MYYSASVLYFLYKSLNVELDKYNWLISSCCEIFHTVSNLSTLTVSHTLWNIIQRKYCCSHSYLFCFTIYNVRICCHVVIIINCPVILTARWTKYMLAGTIWWLIIQNSKADIQLRNDVQSYIFFSLRFTINTLNGYLLPPQLLFLRAWTYL